MYIVYKTTNLINEKIYIGVHNGEKPNYIGSGTLMTRAIKKYGYENFKREILAEFSTKEEAFEYEALLVDKEFVSSENNYNISTGGVGYKEIGENSSIKKLGVCSPTYTKEMRSETTKKMLANRTEEEHKSICQKGGLKGGKTSVTEKRGIFSDNYTDEDRSNASKMGIDKQRELGLSRFSSVHQSKLGKIGGPKNKGFKWYNNGVSDFKYTPSEQLELSFEDFLKSHPELNSSRFFPNRHQERTKGLGWFTDGHKDYRYTKKLLDIMPLEEYIQNNPHFRLGRNKSPFRTCN